MTSKPLLVFDLDGTLAETAGDLMATLNFLLDQEGLPPIPMEEARFLLGAGARALITRGFAAGNRTVEPGTLERLFGAFLAHYEANICVHSHLFPGVVAALDKFEAAGWDFAVCTNKIEHPSILLLNALGVAKRFKAICGQNTFHVCKHHADALLLTIDRAGGVPERSVMVGDSNTDILAAKNAKIPVVAVDFGYTDKPVASLGPDVVISHFDGLWDAVAALNIR